MKKVWIFNHYATTAFKEQGGRHYWFAENLKKKGYEPTIFCASTLHNTDGEEVNMYGKKFRKTVCNGIPFVFLKTPVYYGNGKKRLKNMCSFYFSLFPATKKYSKKYGKPDIIIASSVHPLTCLAGIQIAKKWKISCIIEIRDLWPESILSYSKKKKYTFIVQMLYYLEKWIYKKASRIIFTMEGGKDYIIEKGWKDRINLNKIYYINNGIDLQQFYDNREKYKLEDKDLNDPNSFKVVYTGSIRQVNHLQYLVESAEKLKNTKIKILLFGEGTYKKILEQYCQEKQIKNIYFKGKVDKKYIPYILSKSDLNVLNTQQAQVLKYGCSQNKLFEYAASEKPILSNYKMGYDLILKYGCGIVNEINTPEEYADAILYFHKIKNTEEYTSMCKNAKKLAGDFEFNKLTDKLIAVIESCF